MFIRLSRVLTFVAFLVLFGLLMQTGSDGIARAVIWGFVGVASCYAIIRVVLGRPHSTDQTAGKK